MSMGGGGEGVERNARCDVGGGRIVEFGFFI